ncbi:E3 ubiquitin-protein ligase LRSAM1 isoform X2 [Nilaparvata lugens]|uniref:E3 ubiquitin-protein ligase LRSAM1 isoform X2 n=1 Tax=Nilaparvata lugens TaxID=108931 RepID=UPI00193E4006|nr:E3 ubiquitin-protein ligase LRSAM1 isoform X2 [Nilaparvata lugens]
MAFFGKKKNQQNYKAILEKKLYLAGVDPEPVFDLSECDLKRVPSGIFSLCKVMRKECLLLQCNQLVSLEGGGNIGDLELIIKLNLHSNKLTMLPEGIGSLKNLVDLNVSQNSLKVLPNSVCELRSLRSLDVSFNKLKCLPSNIGRLRKLHSLHLNGNPKLVSLPNTLGLLSHLRDLRLDTEIIDYPPNEVTANGVEAVLDFLSKGCDYTSPEFELSNADSIGVQENLTKHIDFEADDDLFQDMRMKELAAIEHDLKEQQIKELDFQKQRKNEKDELLKNLLVQENCLQHRIVEFQAQKDAERKEVIAHFQKVEEQSDKMLTELLIANRKMMDPAVLEERDRAQREEMLSLQTLDLRRKEVIDAMEKMVAEELEQTAKMLNYELSRDEEARDILTRVEEVQHRLGEAASDLSTGRLHWLAEVGARCGGGSSPLALGLLLERTDAHSQALVSEITLAERQLAALTAVELMRRKVNTDQLTSELCSKRLQLSEILMDLLEQRDQRRQQLLDTLLAIQQSQANCSEDLWLQQYQRLMDRCPQSLQQMLDPLLVHCLVQLNAIHCLPLLSAGLASSVDGLDQIALEKMGVSSGDRELILSALAMYREKQASQFVPSAPELVQTPDMQPSAPPLLPTEDESTFENDGCSCIVCMEGAYEVVFIPCGHLCVCVNCASYLKDCPLCRATIAQKIRAIVP